MSSDISLRKCDPAGAGAPIWRFSAVSNGSGLGEIPFHDNF